MISRLGREHFCVSRIPAATLGTLRTRARVRGVAAVLGLGSLWGIIEGTVGTHAHLSGLPFPGAYLSLVGLSILTLNRRFLPIPGTSLATGVVAAAMKLGFCGPLGAYPYLAILIESAIAEAAFSTVGRWSMPAGAGFAGFLGAGWSLVQPFLTQGLLAGAGLVGALSLLSERGDSLLESGGLEAAVVFHLCVAVAAALLCVALSTLTRRCLPKDD